jgi:hypothetical protein
MSKCGGPLELQYRNRAPTTSQQIMGRKGPVQSPRCIGIEHNHRYILLHSILTRGLKELLNGFKICTCRQILLCWSGE